MIRLLITSGRGPAECRIAVAHVLAAMRREAEAMHLGFDVTTRAEVQADDEPASAIALVSGEPAAAGTFAARWQGSVQWTAASPVRPNHKRKNWFIGVSRLAPPPARGVTLDPRHVRFEPLRAGGPGGQHQNKTESAVRAVHGPTGLAVVAREERSQHRNKALALQRLAELLRLDEALSGEADRQHVQAGHAAVERGRPVRRFTGPRFEEA